MEGGKKEGKKGGEGGEGRKGAKGMEGKKEEKGKRLDEWGETIRETTIKGIC
jgi:hypothetical protein